MADRVAARLTRHVVRPFVAGHARLVLPLEDTPKLRYGPHVPCKGLAPTTTRRAARPGARCLYGHLGVVLAILVPHHLWSVAALSLLARLYVRQTDLPGIERLFRPDFRTKMDVAADLMRWAKIWQEMIAGQIVVGAGRRGVCLEAVPGRHECLRGDGREPLPQGRRPVGRAAAQAYGATCPAPRDGENAVRSARRAGQRRGWTTGTFELYR